MPSKYDRTELARRIVSARKVLAKAEGPLPHESVDKAILIGEMIAHLQMLVEAAEPFSGPVTGS